MEEGSWVLRCCQTGASSALPGFFGFHDLASLIFPTFMSYDAAGVLARVRWFLQWMDICKLG